MGSNSTIDMHNYATIKLDRKPKSEVKKYSLRQRQKRKWVDMSVLSVNSPSFGSVGSTSGTTSNCLDHQPLSPSTGQTATNNRMKKIKAAPLSKYRRKTANARERSRMAEINIAFENLRLCVPESITNEEADTTNEKLTKITTLRLAMKYIRILSESLTQPAYEMDSVLPFIRNDKQEKHLPKIANYFEVKERAKTRRCKKNQSSISTGKRFQPSTKRRNYIVAPSHLRKINQNQEKITSVPMKPDIKLPPFAVDPMSPDSFGLDYCLDDASISDVNILWESDGESIFSKHSLQPLPCSEPSENSFKLCPDASPLESTDSIDSSNYILKQHPSYFNVFNEDNAFDLMDSEVLNQSAFDIFLT